MCAVGLVQDGGNVLPVLSMRLIQREWAGLSWGEDEGAVVRDTQEAGWRKQALMPEKINQEQAVGHSGKRPDGH